MEIPFGPDPMDIDLNHAYNGNFRFEPAKKDQSKGHSGGGKLFVDPVFNFY